MCCILCSSRSVISSGLLPLLTCEPGEILGHDLARNVAYCLFVTQICSLLTCIEHVEVSTDCDVVHERHLVPIQALSMAYANHTQPLCHPTPLSA